MARCSMPWAPEIITQRRYYEIIAEILGVPIRLVAVPSHLSGSASPRRRSSTGTGLLLCEVVTSALGHAACGRA